MQTIETDFDYRNIANSKRTLMLQGFGISIKVYGKKLVITNGKDRLYPDSQFQRIELTDHADFDKIVIQGTGAISFGALQWLTEWGINVIMLDARGRLYGNFNQISGNTEPLIRQKQYECFNDKQRLLDLQKWIISHKITSQILLSRQLGLDTDYMESELAKLALAKTKDLTSIESHVSEANYSNLAKLFNPKLGFRTRRNPMTRRTNEATDVINALLNYGFSILQSEVGKQLNAIGLDCNVGIVHNNHAGYVPLIWDMMEPFRHLVDRSVVAVANSITDSDYHFQIGNLGYPFKSASPFANRWLIVSNELKKRYVATLTAILQSKRYQKAHVGRRTEHGFQKMEEITIMKVMCLELRDYILGKKKTLNNAPKILST